MSYCHHALQLVAVPRVPQQAAGVQQSLLHPGWPVTHLGSAAKMEATVAALARKRKAAHQAQDTREGEGQ